MSNGINDANRCMNFMNLPPLSALTVLDALARRGSVRAAAEEVHLSQSAVSHKLRGLEERLGFALTEPAGRGVVLTGAAQRYLERVRPALMILREAHSDIAQAKGRLEIAVASGFAATWLAPRLPEFLNRYPDVDLHLNSTGAHDATPPCDLEIIFADSPPPNAHLLFNISFFPVCSPEFQHRHGLKTADQVRSDMLLHLNRREDWQQWRLDQGQSDVLSHPGVMFTGLLAMYAAAAEGLGLCLGDAVTCEQALRNGRLLRPVMAEIPAPGSYWAVPPAGGLVGPAAAFVDFLTEQIPAQASPGSL